jgi:methyl-accepting chemotaxis protein
MLSVRRSCRLVAACLIVAGAWLIAPALTDGLATPAQPSAPEATKEAVPPDSSIEENAKLIRTPGERTLYASMVSGSLDDAEEVATVGEGTWLVEVRRDSTGACPTWVEVQNTPALREDKETGDADVLYICDAASKQGTQSTPMYNLAYMLESNAEVRRSETAGGIGWAVRRNVKPDFRPHLRSLETDANAGHVRPGVRLSGQDQSSEDVRIVGDEIEIRFEGGPVPEPGDSLQLQWEGTGVHETAETATVSSAAAGDNESTDDGGAGDPWSLLGMSRTTVFLVALAVSLVFLIILQIAGYLSVLERVLGLGTSEVVDDDEEVNGGTDDPNPLRESILDQIQTLRERVAPEAPTRMEKEEYGNEVAFPKEVAPGTPRREEEGDYGGETEFLEEIAVRLDAIGRNVEEQTSETDDGEDLGTDLEGDSDSMEDLSDSMEDLSDLMKDLIEGVHNRIDDIGVRLQQVEERMQDNADWDLESSEDGTKALVDLAKDLLVKQNETLEEQREVAQEIRAFLENAREETQSGAEKIEAVISELKRRRASEDQPGEDQSAVDQQADDQPAETAPPDEDEETAGARDGEDAAPDEGDDKARDAADEPVEGRTEEREAGGEPEPVGEETPTAERHRPDETATKTGGDQPPHTGEDWAETYRALRDQVWDLSYHDEHKQNILDDLRHRIEQIQRGLRRNPKDVVQECQRIFAEVWDPRYTRQSKAVLDDATEPLSDKWEFFSSDFDGQEKSDIHNRTALDKIDRHMKRENFASGQSYTIIPSILLNKRPVQSEIRYKADYDKYSKA